MKRQYNMERSIELGILEDIFYFVNVVMTKAKRLVSSEATASGLSDLFHWANFVEGLVDSGDQTSGSGEGMEIQNGLKDVVPMNVLQCIRNGKKNLVVALLNNIQLSSTVVCRVLQVNKCTKVDSGFMLGKCAEERKFLRHAFLRATKNLSDTRLENQLRGFFLLQSLPDAAKSTANQPNAILQSMFIERKHFNVVVSALGLTSETQTLITAVEGDEVEAMKRSKTYVIRFMKSLLVVEKNQIAFLDMCISALSDGDNREEFHAACIQQDCFTRTLVNCTQAVLLQSEEQYLTKVSKLLYLLIDSAHETLQEQLVNTIQNTFKNNRPTLDKIYALMFEPKTLL